MDAASVYVHPIRSDLRIEVPGSERFRGRTEGVSSIPGSRPGSPGGPPGGLDTTICWTSPGARRFHSLLCGRSSGIFLRIWGCLEDCRDPASCLSLQDIQRRFHGGHDISLAAENARLHEMARDSKKPSSNSWKQRVVSMPQNSAWGWVGHLVNRVEGYDSGEQPPEPVSRDTPTFSGGLGGRTRGTLGKPADHLRRGPWVPPAFLP